MANIKYKMFFVVLYWGLHCHAWLDLTQNIFVFSATVTETTVRDIVAENCYPSIFSAGTDLSLVCFWKSYYAVITTVIRLQYDYDPTTMYRACLLPFDAIQCEQKMNMSIFRHSRIAVKSNAWRNFGHFCRSRMHHGIVVLWSCRNRITVVI